MPATGPGPATGARCVSAPCMAGCSLGVISEQASRRHHWPGRPVAARQHAGLGLGRRAGGAQRRGHDHAFRRQQLPGQVLLPGARLQRGRLPECQGCPSHGPVHAVRGSRRHPGDPRCRTRGQRRQSRADRADLRRRHRRPGHHRGEPRPVPGGPVGAQGVAAVHSVEHRQHDLGAPLHPVRDPGAEPGCRHGLHDVHARHRTGHAQHPVW